MNHISKCELKIIDFNHSRMFNLDDSPFRVRQRTRILRDKMTEDEVWQEMSELPSPMIFNKSPEKTFENSSSNI